MAKISDLSAATQIADTDVLHLRTTGGIDNKITGANLRNSVSALTITPNTTQSISLTTYVAGLNVLSAQASAITLTFTNVLTTGRILLVRNNGSGGLTIIVGGTTYYLSVGDSCQFISDGTTMYFLGFLDRDIIHDGDHDISGSPVSVNMNTYNALPVGTEFDVSWFGGSDGVTNILTFINAGSDTLNNIALTDYKGQGTGYLRLKKTAANTWITVETPDIWDEDGGNYGGEFKKYIDGTLDESYKDTFSASVNNSSGSVFSSNVLTAPNYPIAPLAINYTERDFYYAQNNLVWLAQTSNAISLSKWTDYYIMDSVSSTAQNFDIVFKVFGRWTTNNPRKKAA